MKLIWKCRHLQNGGHFDLASKMLTPRPLHIWIHKVISSYTVTLKRNACVWHGKLLFSVTFWYLFIENTLVWDGHSSWWTVWVAVPTAMPTGGYSWYQVNRGVAMAILHSRFTNGWSLCSCCVLCHSPLPWLTVPSWNVKNCIPVYTVKSVKTDWIQQQDFHSFSLRYQLTYKSFPLLSYFPCLYAWYRCIVIYCKLFKPQTAWWRYQMEPFAALLALCAGNSPVTG